MPVFAHSALARSESDCFRLSASCWSFDRPFVTVLFAFVLLFAGDGGSSFPFSPDPADPPRLVASLIVLKSGPAPGQSIHYKSSGFREASPRCQRYTKTKEPKTLKMAKLSGSSTADVGFVCRPGREASQRDTAIAPRHRVKIFQRWRFRRSHSAVLNVRYWH